MIVVTGAASGIGAGVTDRLASTGHQVVALDRQWDDDAPRPGVKRWTVDVADADAMQLCFDQACAPESPVTGLVCAAGVQHRSPTISLSSADWHRVLSVHLDGSLFACQLAAARMTNGGSIVLFSSVAERFGWPERAAYAVAKAGLSALARTLAVEWTDRNIRVNSVALGYVDTPLIASARERGELTGDPESLHAIGRMATVAEIVGPIEFLLGECSSFVTGSTFAIDGGYSVFKAR